MTKSSAKLTFDAPVYRLKEWLIFRLPEAASRQLPSRGQVAVEGTINHQPLRAVLEPDGNWGHWLRIDDDLQNKIGVNPGDSVSLSLHVADSWPEPSIPQDLSVALDAASQTIIHKWHDITPMARWEWVRWVGATANPETRKIRIEKTISKLGGKHRRPCCFNLAGCTEPYVTKNGQLLEVQ